MKQWFDRLSESRHHEPRLIPGAQLEKSLSRLIPGMHTETESPPMHRQQSAATQQLESSERIARAEVHITPSGVPGADLEHHEVERAQLRADLRVFSGQA